MDKQTALAKIKKCLALSKSANEHEAAQALKHAQFLMSEFGLTELDVSLAEVSEERIKATLTVPQWHWKLVQSRFRLRPLAQYQPCRRRLYFLRHKRPSRAGRIRLPSAIAPPENRSARIHGHYPVACAYCQEQDCPRRRILRRLGAGRLGRRFVVHPQRSGKYSDPAVPRTKRPYRYENRPHPRR